MSIWDLAPKELRALTPYEPGKPIEEVARELGIPASSIIKIASNENPLGPSPRALEAVREMLAESQLYPDGGCFHLRQTLAEHLRVKPGQLVFGCGSNEIIELVFHAFLSERNGSVIASQYAFIVYKLLSQLFGATFIEVPAKNFAHDLEAMRAAIRPDTRAICIANPNNPTGTRISNAELEKFVRSIPSHILIILDEAYYEYMDSPAHTQEWTAEFPNLIVSRTFSKIYGLAGFRIGFGVFHPETAEIVQRCRQPFNTSSLAQVAAIAALKDTEHARLSREVNTAGMKRICAFFKGRGVEFIPSEGNFLMAKVGDGSAFFKKLLQKGVIIRPLGGYGLKEWVRISIGTDEQMAKLETAWAAVS